MRTAMKQREICKQDEAIALSAAKGSSSATSPLKMMVLLSPTKDSSPGKSRGVGQKRKSPLKSKKSPGKKRSPHFKVPRGRPRTKRGIGSRTVLDARKVKTNLSVLSKLTILIYNYVSFLMNLLY